MLKSLVAIVAIVALAACGASGPSSGTTSAGGRPAPVSAATVAKQLRAFAVLRRSARPRVQIPTEQAVGGRGPSPVTFARLDALLPDGAPTLTVTRAGAAPARLPVAGNTVVYTARGLPGYAFTTAPGVRETRTPLSSGAAPAGER